MWTMCAKPFIPQGTTIILYAQLYINVCNCQVTYKNLRDKKEFVEKSFSDILTLSSWGLLANQKRGKIQEEQKSFL